MKHIALVALFAGALAAQAPQAPQVELAQAIAVEEQERDLGKAETMYREALAGTKLSAGARALANQRLGNLLTRLGRGAEAKPFLDAAAKAQGVEYDDFGTAQQGQDLEREKALREQARELVRTIFAKGPSASAGNDGSPLYGLDRSLAEQLLWIGPAGVPEVVAALEQYVKAHPYQPVLVQGLAAFLWRTGGTQAATFLRAAAANPEFAAPVARGAHALREPAMLEVASAYLQHADWEVTKGLLTGGATHDTPLQLRFEPKLLVDAAEKGGKEWKAFVLLWAARVPLVPELLARVHRMVRAILDSTDPELGSAAHKFLGSAPSQASLEGIELLLRELPKMRGAMSLNMPPTAPPLANAPHRSRFTIEEARRLLPQIDACAKALGPVETGPAPTKWQWVAALMHEVAAVSGPEIVPTVLSWLDLGFEVTFALDEKFTAGIAKDVLGRLERQPGRNQQWVLNELAKVELGRDLFPLLRDAAQRARAGGNPMVSEFALAMAKTGDPEAADWIVAEQARVGEASWSAVPLVELGRKTQAENVRAALRTAAQGNQQPGASCQALLALLAMGDVPALDLVVQKASFPQYQAPHPYATKPERAVLRPIHYLVYENPDPPHGFTDEQVLEVLRKIAAQHVPNDWGPRFFSVGAIKDVFLGELARLVVEDWRADDKRGWIDAVAQRVADRRQRGQDPGPLADWHARMLGSPRARSAVLRALDPDTARALRAHIEPLLDGEDGDDALAALEALGELGPEWFERMLKNRHAGVRARVLASSTGAAWRVADAAVVPLTRDPEPGVREQAADYLGARVSKEAVPDLIALLRDPRAEVRTAAANALTRIRFYHEQQAHWDRVLKGLDASPASAAEKLLLQAKPGAQKAQRLLAIESLGALGVPEALPFLIEWTGDADAEVAAKAKAAITQIHLNPRR
jgi:hypothetical protein